jgi:hypothetical protein
MKPHETQAARPPQPASTAILLAKKHAFLTPMWCEKRLAV